MNNKMVNDYLMMPKDENFCSIVLIFAHCHWCIKLVFSFSYKRWSHHEFHAMINFSGSVN